jgi:hypothetical protein
MLHRGESEIRNKEIRQDRATISEKTNEKNTGFEEGIVEIE